MTSTDETANSRFYNLFVLRRLFNKGNAGRGIQGQSRRVSLHTTVTPLTFMELAKVVPTGKGKYSAPVIELGIRLQLALLGTLRVETVGEELALAVKDRQTLASTMRVLASFIERYTPAD